MSEKISFNGLQLIKVKMESIVAPCTVGSEVFTIDENKEAMCYCRKRPEGCCVDARNRVIEIPPYIIVSTQ